MSELPVNQIEQLINKGRFLEARELASRLKSGNANLVRLDQLIALSLNKSGAPEAARASLEPVYLANQDDPETAGIMGSIYKELFRKHQDPKYALLSRDTYLKNFGITRNYYTGINAATMSAIAGRSSQGREIALEVITLLEAVSAGFWEVVTLAEAYLLTRNREKSVEFYIRGRQLAGNDWGKVISVHQQLWLLDHYAPVPKDILKAFSPPEVVSFIGHMIDRPERSVPRFPASIEENVKSAIKGSIRTLNIAIGYCSLACGSDILFAEAMEEAGAELHILLPFSKDDFVETSIRFAGEQWVQRFERLIAAHPVHIITPARYDDYNELFVFQSKIIFGTSILRSLSYHNEPTLLTVMSQTDLTKKEGGTRGMLRWWPFPARHTNINPDQLLVSAGTAGKPATTTDDAPDVEVARPLLYLVHADLSALTPLHRDAIIKSSGIHKEKETIQPRFYENGGDYIMAGYEQESNAIGFAQMLWNQSPVAKGERLLSIGLHAGLTHFERLPGGGEKITGDESLGLIKTITRFAPIGSVCASDHFAALLALHPGSFRLDYLGVVEEPGDQLMRAVYRVGFNS